MGKSFQPVRCISGVGETEDSTELHYQGKVEDYQRLLVELTWDIKLLQGTRNAFLKNIHNLISNINCLKYFLHRSLASD